MVDVTRGVISLLDAPPKGEGGKGVISLLDAPPKLQVEPSKVNMGQPGLISKIKFLRLYF